MYKKKRKLEFKDLCFANFYISSFSTVGQLVLQQRKLCTHKIQENSDLKKGYNKKPLLM